MARRLVGLPSPAALAYQVRRRPAGRCVIVLKDQDALEDFSDSFAAVAPLFPDQARECAMFGEDERGRMGALEKLRRGVVVIAAIPEALEGALPAPSDFSGGTTIFKAGEAFPRAKAVEALAHAGYQRVDFVESPGEFAVRGAILDFHSIEPPRACRVLYDEDKIASIRVFDPVSQETQELLTEAAAPPAGQGAPATASLKDWAGPEASWIVSDDAPNATDVAAAAGERGRLAGRLLEASAEDEDAGLRPHAPHAGQAGAFAAMGRLAAEGWKVLLFSLNRGEDGRMQDLLEDKLAPGACQFLIGALSQGFLDPAAKIAAFCTSEIFERRYRRASGWKSVTAKGGLRVGDLRQGDYVVHQDYGVARYRGLKPVESPGHGVVDCLELEFRGTDRLFVSMTEFGRIQRYSGAEGKRPRLSSLDTRHWEELKREVSEGARELAIQLLRVQAVRAARPGHAFPPETPMEREFAEAFPYEETPDQAAAISAVLSDMEAPRPMDRVVIGDVGFGKTEVAMRACFKCAASGFKQAVVLVPTTILADQHYRTFVKRFAGFPVETALLTRFQSPAEQKRVIEGLKSGKIDVVIGTARLLQKGISFKDLGLLVIDEEHRFGVKDKEKLKSFRAHVDMLSLSATPIPRTLNQAMSGLKGISLIQSAPTGRQPIITRVGPWHEGALVQAVNDELSRGGQVYYVHNRVRSLTDCVKRLETLLPGVRVGKVHGQMKAAEIEQAMWDFFNRKFDVLVASTIIESGLDIPTVNTLLVEDAHEFGLAQLYQLRGRIGRESRRAYCLLFYPEGVEDLGDLSEEARKRLEALKEFGELGAGVKLAMRDLEIRGAGELLGARQHGFLKAVGADYYSQVLMDEVDKLRGRAAPEEKKDVHLDIRLPAYIPEAYLPGELERLNFYKQILKANVEEAEKLRSRLKDLCGPPPEPVLNLFKLMTIRALAQKAGVHTVIQKGGRVEAYFRADASVDPGVMAKWMNAYKGRLSFLKSEEGDGVTVDLGDEKPLEWLEDFLLGLLGGK